MKTDLERISLSHQKLSNEQLLDAGDRLGELLLDEDAGLPAGDEVTRNIAGEMEEATGQLAERLGLERRGTHTRAIQRHEGERDEFVRALRRGAKTILSDPDPALETAIREGAAFVWARLNERKTGFERLSNAENSAELTLLLADLEGEEGTKALRDSGLDRHHALLVQANDAFLAAVRKDEVEQATRNADERLDLRTIKRNLCDHARLAFDILAHFARQEREPYAGLYHQAREIVSEVTSVARRRETLSGKAAAEEVGISG